MPFVGDHQPPDAGRDLAFEAAHRSVVGPALADLALVIPTFGAVVRADPG